MNIDPQEYHKTITHEIKALQNRVRYLLGDAHWGEEGRYKEAVLRSVIRRFLPSNIGLGSGFIIDRDKDAITLSKQIDIIIYDNAYPVLFSEGDFIITTPANIRGIIEVKTKINSNAHLKDIITTATQNGRIMKNDIFNGIFSFDVGNLSINSERLSEGLIDSKGTVNHLAIGENIFIKHWPQLWNTTPDTTHPSNEYDIYEINDFSFTYFISNLLEYLSEDRMKERWWFQYPIPKGKQEYVVKTIPLD